MVVDGGVSVCSPAEWVVDREKNDGATIVKGARGRLSVTVLDTLAPRRDPESFMDTLEIMSPGLRVIEQADFNAGGGRGKEFVVSCLEEGRKRSGVVYLIGKDKKLCVLTFIVLGNGLEKWLDVFRESAGTLKFLETSGDENKDSKS